MQESDETELQECPTEQRGALDGIDPEDRTEETNSGDKLTMVGWWLSGTYFVFLFIMAMVAWEKLFSLDPNGFGDMLAGVFAPLAFLWLVLGFYQQGKELKASVSALKLQGDELRNSVNQQRELVAVTREQLEAEVASARETREAAEHAAQAVWVPLNGGSYSGNQSVSFRVGARNVGVDATHVELWRDGKRLIGRPLVTKNDDIEERLKFGNASDLKPFVLYVTYFDGLGQKRGRRLSYEVIKGGGPNGVDSVHGIIEETLYKPPFPWTVE